MNREQKRKTIKSFIAKGYTAKQAENFLAIKALENAKKFLKEGDKVKLNISQITSHPDWKAKRAQFKEWVQNHRDMVLTVEYDKNHTKNPAIVCVREDETDPKWLFWEGDLDVVERSEDGRWAK